MTKGETHLTLVNEKLSGLISEKVDACPKNFNKTRFLQNCLTVLKDLDPVKLSKCNPESIALTMIKGAFLGLDFFNKECYAIPFGNDLQFLTDYKGDIKLARQYSVKPIMNIYARLVREGDTFESKVENGRPIVNFAPKDFSDAEIKGAFAVVVYKDESMDYAVMSKAEIEGTRHNYSKCPNSPAWNKSPGEMYKKTVLKRLCKLIELNFDNAEQSQAFQEGADIKKDIIDVSPEVTDPFDKEKAAPATLHENHLTPKGEKEEIAKVLSEIEKTLVEKQKHPSTVFKIAKEVFKKELSTLTLDEMVDLRAKIQSGLV